MRSFSFKVTRFSALVLLMIVGGCASYSAKDDAWPGSIPKGQAYYESLYQDADANAAVQSQDDYLKWVKRFYIGWTLYPNGWHWLTENALESTSSQAERRELSALLGSLGIRIGGEWAKNSKHRQINTSHLMTWGNALKLSVKEGGQVDMARRISRDVDDLLAYRLEPDLVDFDRYSHEPRSVASYEDDPFEL